MPSTYSFEELLKDEPAGGTAVATPKTASTLVNESPKYDFNELLQPPVPPTYEQLHSKEGIEAQAAQMKYREALPKTWFGEAIQGGKVGIDQLQQLGYSGGAILADMAGTDKLRDWFIAGSRAQDKEIAGEPLNVEDTDEIHGFDSFMRWFMGSAGKAFPQLAESAITGIAGAAMGSSVGPEGTIGGAVTGFVEKQAVKNLIKTKLEGIVKNELEGFANRAIKREALSEAAKTALVNETGTLLKKYGANTAVGLNSWATETASIYDSTKDDPNTSESSKKAAALLGGFVAAIPDTAFKSYVASKFFKGAKVSNKQVEDAERYMFRLMKEGGKEIAKAIPGGFGEEYGQTLVETAAKLYSNPETRDNFLNFTPAQWHEALQAGYQGLVVEGVPVAITAPLTAVKLKPHPDPKVREKQDTVTARANDLQPEVTVNIGPDEERLSKIATRQNELGELVNSKGVTPEIIAKAEEELNALQAEEDLILGVKPKEETPPVVEPATTEPLVNEKGTEVPPVTEAETEAPEGGAVVVKPPSSTLNPLERAVTHLRSFYEQEMANRGPKQQPIPMNVEGVAQQREKLTNLVNEITRRMAGTEEAQQYADAIHQVFDDDVLNFLHHENIDIRSATPYDKRKMGGDWFALVPRGENGGLVLPDISEVVRVAKKRSMGKSDHERSVKDYLKAVPDILQQEIVHAFDFVAIRDQWKQGKQIGSKVKFDEFHANRVTERGAAFRKAWKYLPRQMFSTYDFGKIGKMDDEQLGDEFMRAVVQTIRTGKIDELTMALQKAAAQAGPESKGPLDGVLKQWIRALTQVYKKMRQFFDPMHSSAQFVQDYHAITETLDRYNVLVNESESRKASEEAVKQEAAAKAEAEAAAEAAKAEKAKQATEKPAKPTKTKAAATFIQPPSVVPTPPIFSPKEAKLKKAIERAQVKAAAKKKPAKAGPPTAAAPRRFWMDRSGNLQGESGSEIQNELHVDKAIRILGDEASQYVGKEEETMLERGYLRGARADEVLYVKSNDRPTPSQLRALKAYGEYHGISVDWEHPSGILVTLYEPPGRAIMASRPKIRKEDQAELEEASTLVNERNQVKFQVKPSQEKRRGGTVLWEGATAEQLRYDSLTETESAAEAQAAIDSHGGALNVAEKLMEDKTGNFLGFNEDDPNSIVPHAKVFSTYANVVSQLTHILKDIKGRVRDGTYAYVEHMWTTLAIRLASSTTSSAQASQIGNSGMQIRDGLSAKKTYVDTLMEHLTKVLGKDAKASVQGLVRDLNETMAKGAPLASVAPKIIGQIRHIQKTVDKVKFAKGHRQTVIKNLEELKKIVSKAAARAANEMAESDINPEKMQRFAKQLIKEFNGLPQDHKARTTEQIFSSTVVRFMRGIGKEVGRILPKEKAEKETVSQAMAIILKNEPAFEQFISMFVSDYVKEYGGSNPSQMFLNQVADIHQRMRAMFGGKALIKALVNEKMQQFKMSFSEIVSGYYRDPEFEFKSLREDIAKDMKDQGITDPTVIDQLVKDIEESTVKSLEEAYRKFYGSAAGIKDTLKYMEMSLAEVTSDLLIHHDKLEGDLKDALIRQLGFPDTPELPLATTMAKLMQDELNIIAADENSKQIQKWMEQAENAAHLNAKKPDMKKALDLVLQMTKAGVMRQEDLYQALQEHFTELPKFDQKVVDQLEHYGEAIYNSQFPRQANALKQLVADLLASSQPLSTTQVKTAAMYVSFLSGPSTILAANPIGNLSQTLAFFFENVAKSWNKPALVYDLFRAVFATVKGKAAWEFRETLFTGMELGKAGNKYSATRSPFELNDSFLKNMDSTGFLGFKGDKAQTIDKKITKGAFWWMKNVGGGKLVMRSLMAADVFFAKIAEEIAFTQKVGAMTGTEEMWLSAQTKARQEMLNIGEDPTANKRNHSRFMVLANSLFENARLYDDNGDLVNERALQWMEANGEALRVTLNQEPKGLMGAFHRALQTASNEYPALKLFVPFTRIAANSVNMALQYTPLGFWTAYASKSFMKETEGKAMIDKETWGVTRGGDTKMVRDTDIAIRAAIGSLAMMTIAALMGSQSDDPEDEPFFWIYGNGPRDKTMRGLLFERGWKPNSVKVGGVYLNYLLTPFSMAFSIMGYHADKYLDGQTTSPNDIFQVSSGVALMDAVMNQSFLASISDFMGAVDSPDPESKLNRLFARTASVVLPSWVKQVDRFVDPSMQEAKGFLDVMTSQIPLARHALKPYLNYFGQPVHKSNGMLPFPGMQVLATAQRSNDSVIVFLTDNSIEPPGYSKSTRLGDKAMTDDQRYEYIQIAGPKIHDRIQGELSDLASMDAEHKKERVRQIAEEEKAKARSILKQKYLQ